MAGFIIGAVAAVGILMTVGIRVDAQKDKLESWYAYIDVVCEQKDICPEFVQALIEQESNWKPDARNGDCVGLMQISEKWHQDRMERLGVTDLTDPYDNILTGVAEQVGFAESKASSQPHSENTTPAPDEDGFMAIPDGIDEEMPF